MQLQKFQNCRTGQRKISQNYGISIKTYVLDDQLTSSQVPQFGSSHQQILGPQWPYPTRRWKKVESTEETRSLFGPTANTLTESTTLQICWLRHRHDHFYVLIDIFAQTILLYIIILGSCTCGKLIHQQRGQDTMTPNAYLWTTQ